MNRPPGTTGDLPIRSLAARAGLSERHFTRLFRGRAGMSAREYAERARVSAAARLPAGTARSAEAAAREAGFGTEGVCPTAFLRVPRLSPLDHREEFS
ncbi:helix-turn-helix domain-containing protein [Streptomyces sp. P17]|uniref:helix-turn-helix domain-containing protein n=1 Tax=Streptomyces sp. P17 TaxID=3074716 RepID=UPI0028F45BD0|nr:helix-turn-helix domain-containing protein [Streptomyces sp. P17]MDT9698089.1 helix-turn-helix domain-containing protein [Streptomyces sp. P17]